MIGVGAYSNMSQPITYNAGYSTGSTKTADADSVKKAEQTVEQKDISTDKKKEDKAYLEDLVAVSEYGDTLQVSEEGHELSESGIYSADTKEDADTQDTKSSIDTRDAEVIAFPSKKEVPENFNIDTKASSDKEIDMGPMFEDEDEKTADVPTSFAGYTKSQLNQMYLKGEISQYKYETEIEKRNEETQGDISENKKSSEDIGKMVSVAAGAKRDEIELTNIFADDTSDKISDKNRMAAIDGLNSMLESGQTAKFVIGEIA
ncbi:MAG: hypothetical protein IJV15_06470 [Lachnospiraceae bacterium]|nr:hypothetical protein [Lachnospiraceae bacterium]